MYYTVDKGVWKDSESTREIYDELEKGVSPYVGEFKKQIPFEVITSVGYCLFLPLRKCFFFIFHYDVL